jgi:hypothetical protein
MSARAGIPKAIATKMATEIDGTGIYRNNLYGSVENKVMHFSDINNFPLITITPGPETRDDNPSNHSMCELDVYCRVFAKDNNDPQLALETLVSDVEDFLDTNLSIEYEEVSATGVVTRNTVSNDIIEITTDEGLLAPEALAEIVIKVKYEKIRKF